MFASAPAPLSNACVQRYHQDGFVVLPNLLTADACQALTAHAHALAETLRPDAPDAVFATGSAQSLQHLRASARGVQCFFEPAPGRVVNKIGHALHALDPAFAPFSRHPLWHQWAQQLGVQTPYTCQSMLIFKQPSVGGAVHCHQDATFLHTDPANGVGLWFALEDATRANGCLWAIPGAHGQGLKKRLLQPAHGPSEHRTLDDTPFVGEPVPLEVPRGSAILLHALCPHESSANTSPHSRLAYTLHVLDRQSTYTADNWLQDPL